MQTQFTKKSLFELSWLNNAFHPVLRYDLRQKFSRFWITKNKLLWKNIKDVINLTFKGFIIHKLLAMVLFQDYPLNLSWNCQKIMKKFFLYIFGNKIIVFLLNWLSTWFITTTTKIAFLSILMSEVFWSLKMNLIELFIQKCSIKIENLS